MTNDRQQLQIEKARVMESAASETARFVLKWGPANPMLPEFQADLRRVTDIWQELGSLGALEVMMDLAATKPISDQPS